MTRGRLYGFVAVVFVAVTLSAFLITRNTRQEVRADGSPAPGFDGRDRAVDDSPFELAEPTTTEGPTTIPGGARPRRSTTTTSTTSTTTTTTTTIPTSPLLPRISSITSLCGMIDSIQSVSNVFIDTSLDPESVMTGMLIVLDRYAEVSPPDLVGDVRAIRTLFGQLTDQMRDAGWDAQDPGVLRSVDSIRSETPPFGALQGHARRVEFHEAATCPT